MCESPKENKNFLYAKQIAGKQHWLNIHNKKAKHLISKIKYINIDYCSYTYIAYIQFIEILKLNRKMNQCLKMSCGPLSKGMW